MRAENLHAICQRLPADDEHDDGFIHPVAEYAVAGLERPMFAHNLFKIGVAGGLGRFNQIGGSFALGFAMVDKAAIFPCKGVYRIHGSAVIFCPG